MPTREIFTFCLIAALAAAGGALAQTEETPEQILAKVDARLLAWDTAGARELYDQLPGPGELAAKIAAGRLLSQEGRLDEAAAKLSEAVAAAPRDPSPAIYLGETHRLAGRAEEARAAFEQAAARATAGLETAPESVRLLVALGVAKQNLRELPQAIEALEKAQGLAPGNVEATYQLGVCHAIARNWARAVDVLTQALEKNPRIAYAYYFRGLAADKVDRKDLLINDLNRFLDLAPNSPDAPRVRSILSAVQG